jgi:hypothetical protein
VLYDFEKNLASSDNSGTFMLELAVIAYNYGLALTRVLPREALLPLQKAVDFSRIAKENKTDFDETIFVRKLAECEEQCKSDLVVAFPGV